MKQFAFLNGAPINRLWVVVARPWGCGTLPILDRLVGDDCWTTRTYKAIPPVRMHRVLRMGV